MKKPIIVFGLASAGMGHATRDVAIIERLNKTYEVHIFCSGRANSWLKKQFHHVHSNHPIKGVKYGEKISLFGIVLKAFFELPKSLFYIFRIAFFILVHRPIAIITDFEAHCVYAALLTRVFRKVPIISCDHWTTMRLSKIPFQLDENETREFIRWKKIISFVVPFADHYLVHKTLQTSLSAQNAIYVPTPVRDSILTFRQLQKHSPAGPIVVSMGHLSSDSLGTMLKKCQSKFIVYGEEKERVEENIEYRNFNEEEYFKSLSEAPFAIVAANSSAIDAIAMGKAFIYCPTPGQFEQKFCGKMFEYLGIALLVNELRSEDIDSFQEKAALFQKRVNELDIFDNDLLCHKIESTIHQK